MANTSANYRIKLAAVLDTKTINQQINQLNKNNTLKELKIKVTISDASLKKIKELNDLLNKTEALNKYTSGLKNIQETMKSYEKIASKVVTASKNAVTATDNIGKAAKSAEPKVKSFGDKAADAFKKFSLWSAVSSIFYQVVNAVKGLVNTAIELDSAFTELQKVTDLTMDDFDELTEKAYGLGSEVAKTTTEAVNAMTEFAKAGYSVEESTDILAKNALMWTNIADGTVDASESANMIISVMKAFNIEAENTTHIIDALNEVSNNFAVSSGDLSNSLTKSSAVLANAGVTFEEQLGLITSGTEILRNANIVSNGLKTISLRLQGMEEDGEAVDGLSAKLEADFNKLGLTLYGSNYELKSTYEILGDLASVYPTLTEAEKAYYTELIAGKNRAQVAAAILNNFNTALKATETAYNSTGSAAAENAKVMESLNGRIKILKAEWESLVNSEATQKTLKFFVDLTTNTVQLIKALGGLRTVLIAISALFINAKFGLSIRGVAESIYLTYLYSKDMLVVGDGLLTKFNALNVASKSLGTSSMFMVAKLGLVALAIAGLIKLVDAFTVSYTELEEEASALSDELRSVNEDLKDVENQLEENEKKITEINAKPLDIINENTLETLKKENEELGIQKQLLLDIQKEKGRELGETTQELLTKKRKAEGSGLINNKLFKKTGVTDPYSSYSETIDFDSEFDILTETQMLLDARHELENRIEAGDYAKDGWESFKTGKETLDDLNEKIKNNTNLLTMNMEALMGHKKNLQLDNAEQKESYDIISGLEKQYLALRTLDTDFNEFSEIYNHKDLEATKEKVEGLARSGELTADVFKEKFPELVVYFEAIGLSIDEVIARINTITTQNKKAALSTDNFKGSLEELSTSLENNQKAYDAIKSATDEYSENGRVSIETLQTLISEYPEYLKLLTENGWDLGDVTKELKDNTQEMIDNARAANELDYMNKIMSIDWQTLKYDIAGYTQALLDNKQAYEDYLANEKMLKALEDSLNSNGFNNNSNNNSKKQNKDPWLEEFEKAYDDLKNRRDRDIIDTKTYYAELDKLNNKYFKDRVKYEEQFAKYKLELYKGEQEIFDEDIDKLDHQIAMMEYNEVDTETLIAKHRETQARIHEQAEYYRELDLEGNAALIDELEELWWKYERDIDKLREAEEEKIQERFEAIQKVAIEAIDAEIEALENDLEKQNDLLDEAIARYEEENDALEDQEEIQEKLLAIEEARKKLAEAKNNKVRVYREGKGFVYETDFDAVAEAQSELDSLLEEWDLFQEKSKIADIIAQLEAEKEANEKRVEEEIKDLNRLKDEWDKSLDISKDIEEYKAYLEELGESEQSNFNKRLKAVKDFTEAYKAEMATLSSTPTTGTSSTTSGSLGYASGQRGSGKNSYNVFVDYQAELDKAIASGAPEDHLAYLEMKRNNKIDGEGLDYEKTYNYQYVPGKSGGSSSGSSSSSKSSSNKSSSSSSSLLSKVTSAISSIGNAIKSATGLATGTDNADGLMHFVGENGPELYVPPKGSGIIPNPSTTNLMAWGALNPMDLVRRFGDAGSTNIDIDNITLPNVKDAKSFVEELKNFKSFAIQKQSVRR